MSYYKSFNAEALELSKSLPEEQSELYKRYFIPLPLQNFIPKMNGDGGAEEEALLKDLSRTALANLSIRFDALFGSSRHIINESNKHIRVVPIHELTEEHLANKMFKSKEDKLIAFIHAYTRRIVFIDIPQGEKVDINLLFANTDIPFTTQVVVNVAKDAKLNLFEWYASRTSGKSFLGVMHEINVGAYANADVSLVHNEDANTYIANFSKGNVSDNGLLNVNYIYNGGLSARAKNEVSAKGFQAKSNLIELVMGSGEQKFDLNTIIANLGKDTVSDLESKAALMDTSACMLKGFADVGDNASGSRSFVNERGILLDKKAYMSSIPGMSIKNSNVKATHSSATAPVDDDSLFYLMSRGANDTTAKRLLIAGFFSSSIAKMQNPLVKSAVSSLMFEKINNKRFGTIPKENLSSIWAHSSSEDMFEGHYKYRQQK